MAVNASAATDRAAGGLSGDSIIREINESGIEFVISVPDITTSEGLLRPLARGPSRPKDGVASLAHGPRLIRICKEDEGVAICAGLAYTGKRGLLLIQQTCLLDSINAVRGVAVEYSLPICMMVGLLEKEVGVMPRQSKRYGVRIVEPILEAMGIGYHNIEAQADVAKIRPAIDAAFNDSKPTVILIGQRPS
jgi:sulfopyruvate decarboxylase subunit alpha